MVGTPVCGQKVINSILDFLSSEDQVAIDGKDLSLENYWFNPFK